MTYPGDLIHLRLAARRLRVSPQWLARETAAGRLPGLRAGDTYLYDWPTLESALRNLAQKLGAGGEGGGSP